MNEKFFTRTLGLTLGVASVLWAFACSSGDESLGHDENAASQNSAGTTSQNPSSCDTVQCFRPVECVESCGGPIVRSSCCPCAAGQLDQLIDCSVGAGGATSDNGGAPGNPGSGGVSAAGAPGNGEGGAVLVGSGGEGGAVLDLTGLGSNCVDDACSNATLTPLHYYGFAGEAGPLFCTCEIPCEGDPNLCPPTTTCVVISDGPGAVCQVE